MLSELHVKNFAILDEVSVEFGKGLNVLTGETGAGKSLLLGSVNAALGGKVSKDFLGSNGDYALAELLFDNDACVRDLLEKYELPESDMLVISRRITDTGRSVSRINGETVNASIVKEIASRLFDVHGQHDHQTLLYPAKQLALLDRYAGAEALAAAAEVRALARDYRAAKKELADASEHGAARARELSMAQYEYDEIMAARLVAGEDDLLEERFRVLSNREKLTEACAEADSVLSTDATSVTTGIGRALRKLSKASSLDPKLEAIYEDLRLAEEQVGDIAARLSDYLSEITGTEAELNEVGERLDVINRLKSKYGRTIEAILAYAEEAERTIAKLRQLCRRPHEEGEGVGAGAPDIGGEAYETSQKSCGRAVREGAGIPFGTEFSKLRVYGGIPRAGGAGRDRRRGGGIYDLRQSRRTAPAAGEDRKRRRAVPRDACIKDGKLGKRRDRDCIFR